MKKIFLTGGTGFFGKSILEKVKNGTYNDYSFTILSRDPVKFLLENPQFNNLNQVKFITGDVRDFVFPKESFDYIFHAGTPAMHMPVGVEQDIIINGTKRVLSFAKYCNAQKFMFVSSGGVYGKQPYEVEHLSEDYLCKPYTEYGIAKLEAEEMCKESGVFTVIPRCFAFTGKYLNRNIHFAIGNFIRDALLNQPIIITGDGTPYRSYLYADDLVDWLFTLLEKGANKEVYNVGSDYAISIANLATLVKKVLNSKSEVIVKGVPKLGDKPERYIPSIEKAKNLGLNVNIALEDAILKSI